LAFLLSVLYILHHNENMLSLLNHESAARSSGYGPVSRLFRMGPEA
jgi:hypothetical protein